MRVQSLVWILAVVAVLAAVIWLPESRDFISTSGAPLAALGIPANQNFSLMGLVLVIVLASLLFVLVMKSMLFKGSEGME